MGKGRPEQVENNLKNNNKYTTFQSGTKILLLNFLATRSGH
jgi:hypothetical protein